MTREIFMSDGSIRSSHNTDDLFERWLIRSGGELSNIVDIKNNFLDQRNINEEITTEQQARIRREIIRSEVRRIDSQLGRLDKGSNFRIRGELIKRKERLLAVGRSTKEFINIWSNLDSNEVLKSLADANDPVLGSIASELLTFRHRGKNSPRVSYETFQNICLISNKIRDTLMARKLSEKED